ncbi:hypothetical protein SAMN04487775_11061 [Treponema bryantii]|uniref:Uncharacterized protein n=1 Tax=Treponema bryantii TaxID=163 RepID=A0A1I3MRY0_9SPIR|nr:hypothetical protein [Treponema bryantii]SFI99570.1 hypothetical protein SAMN04487775_11061 [Treponema bryantii]
MGIPVEEIVTGRKTFFILPDTSLMPESFLDDYFALGYECYYVPFDKRINVQKKVKVITSLFKDLIIFFNIDYELPGLDWEDYIYDYIHEYNNANSVGILYTKRQSKLEKTQLERKYLYEYGCRCGCIQLEYQKNNNFDLIGKILFANQAQGRRKTIRALCSSSCTYTYYRGQNYNDPVTGSLQDISLSHFTILVSGDDLGIKLYEKIQDIHFNLKGFLFRSGAILAMERPVNGGMLYVFSFINSNGSAGLDDRIREQLIPALYKILSNNCNHLLDQTYAATPDDLPPEDSDESGDN